MIRFPTYAGPQINNLMNDYGQENWLPITPINLRCECQNCSRSMFSDAVAKTDSVSINRLNVLYYIGRLKRKQNGQICYMLEQIELKNTVTLRYMMKYLV